MVKNLLLAGVLFFSATALQAADALSADELNLLRIQRRQLIEQRDQALKSFVDNEKKIEMLLAWANGEHPNFVKQGAKSASAVTAGALAWPLLKKYAPRLINALPPKVQKYAKYTPAVAGLLAGSYFGYDSVQYKKITDFFNETFIGVTLENRLAFAKAYQNDHAVALDEHDVLQAYASAPSLNPPAAPVAPTPAPAVNPEAPKDPAKPTATPKPEDKEGPQPGVVNKKMDEYYQKLKDWRLLYSSELLMLTQQVHALDATLHIYE